MTGPAPNANARAAAVSQRPVAYYWEPCVRRSVVARLRLRHQRLGHSRGEHVDLSVPVASTRFNKYEK